MYDFFERLRTDNEGYVTVTRVITDNSVFIDTESGDDEIIPVSFYSALIATSGELTQQLPDLWKGLFSNTRTL